MEFAARAIDRIIVVLISITFGLDHPQWVLDIAKVCLCRVMKIGSKALSDRHMSDIASLKLTAPEKKSALRSATAL